MCARCALAHLVLGTVALFVSDPFKTFIQRSCSWSCRCLSSIQFKKIIDGILHILKTCAFCIMFTNSPINVVPGLSMDLYSTVVLHLKPTLCWFYIIVYHVSTFFLSFSPVLLFSSPSVLLLLNNITLYTYILEKQLVSWRNVNAPLL